MAVAAPAGRADRQHHHVGTPHRIGDVLGEGEPPGIDIGGDQRLEPRLVDRHSSCPKRRDPLRRGIDAGHGEAELGEAGRRYQADISGTNHRHTHRGAPRSNSLGAAPAYGDGATWRRKDSRSCFSAGLSRAQATVA